MDKLVLKTECICCGSQKLTQLYDFGNVPLAGNYIKKNESFDLFPLSISFCEQCYNIQVDQYINSKFLFSDYRYMSRFSMLNHFRSYLHDLKSRFNDLQNFKIVEIGSNDGTFLQLLKGNCSELIGFEPSKNISKYSIDSGDHVINDFFSKEAILRYELKKNSVDIVSASNCFAHIEDIDSILEGVKYILKKETGSFIVEVHYTPLMINDLQYDFIYHEHMYYYSLSSLIALFDRHGFMIYDFELIPVHGGSIRVYSKMSKPQVHSSKIKNQLLKEIKFYKKNVISGLFSLKIFKHIIKSKEILLKIKNDNKCIVGFGASGRVNSFLNYLNLPTGVIDYILDESPERYDRFIPNVNIYVKEYDISENYKFDTLYLSAWNFSNIIIEKTNHFNYKNSIQFFPEISCRKK